DKRFSNRTNMTDRFNEHEREGRFISGSESTEFCDAVAPGQGEYVVSKGSVSPFASTGLLQSLLARDLRRVAVAGIATHLAIESAVREGSDRGLKMSVIEDACASPEPLHTQAVSTVLPSFAEMIDVKRFKR